MDNEFQPDEPLPVGPDAEANEKAFQSKLQEYQKALEQEWRDEQPDKEGKLSPEQVRSKTDDLLIAATPRAVGSLLHLSQHAKSEQVRLNASKFIIEEVRGKAGVLSGDPMEVLLKKLTAPQPTEASERKD